MKKLLALAVVALFATNAHANVRIDNDDVPQTGTMQFNLAVDSTYVFKLLNDKADADNGTAGNQEDNLSIIDLGQITAGVPLAGTTGNCSDLAGLTQAAALGVAAQGSEAETGLPVTALTASCMVKKQGANIDLRMAIPLESILMKTGAGTVDISYSVAAATGDSFNAFRLCEGPAVAQIGLDGVSLPACGTVKANVLAANHAHSQEMHVLLEARLSGSGAKAEFQDQVDVAIAVNP